MFSLTLQDHLNLTFSQVSERHRAHSKTAESYRKWHRRLKGCEALLIGSVSLTAAAAAYGYGRFPAIAAASMAGIALIALLIDLTFDFEHAAHAHASCSARLWEVRDKYASLLSDLSGGVLSVADARQRRDQLMSEVRAAYERTALAPPADFHTRVPEDKEPAELGLANSA
jgi:hypothetical protein